MRSWMCISSEFGVRSWEVSRSVSGWVEAVESRRELHSRGGCCRPAVSNLQEYCAGTDPTDPACQTTIGINVSDGSTHFTVTIPAAAGFDHAGFDRYFRAEQCDDLADGLWIPVPGAEFVPAYGNPFTVRPTSDDPASRIYRTVVWLQPAPSDPSESIP